MNTRNFLVSVVQKLELKWFEVYVFGWWWEELLHTVEPREHKDIDLFLVHDNFHQLDECIQSTKLFTEILPKRFPHKRAVMYEWVMIEFFLVNCVAGVYSTIFFDEVRYVWWTNSITKNVTIWWHVLKVVDSNIIQWYRLQFNSIEQLRMKYMS